MKDILKLIMYVLLLSTSYSLAQDSQNQKPCSDPACKQFDFWVGEWNLTWPGGQAGTPEGEVGQGTNSIRPILGGCVIQENFANPISNYNGKSWSVYNPTTQKWKQTWVDNSGGYLLFEGAMVEGKMELRTKPFTRDGKEFVSRMVFSDIATDSFTWYWQRSADGGESWSEVWTITYTRAGK